MPKDQKGEAGQIAFITKNFLPPTQIWILRQAKSLSRFRPVFVVKNKVPNSPWYGGRIYAMQSYRAVIALFDFIGRIFSKNSHWGSAWFFKVVFWRNRAQLVHIHFLWNALWFFRIHSNPKIPVVITAHGSDVNKAFVDSTYRKEIQETINRVDKVICVSEFIRQKLLELGCQKEKLIVNYLGIPIKNATPLGREDTDHIKLICVAALRKEKGHIYLLKALENVKNKFQDIRLILVGDGELKQELIRTAKEIGLEDCVEFMGWKTEDEVFELLAAADIYVQHSIRFKAERHWKEEALSMSLVEAASVGLPLVTTDIGGVPEICIHGHNGLLSEEKDIQAMAENINFLIENPDSRLLYGQMGRELVSKRFDESSVLPQLETIYQTLLNKL